MIRTAPDLNPPENLWNAEDDKIGNWQNTKEPTNCLGTFKVPDASG
jgi:hypothetical protein